MFFVLPCYITVKVIPNAAKTEIKETMSDGTLKVSVASPAEKGKANQELISYFKKMHHIKASIVGGETDRKKLIRLEAL